MEINSSFSPQKKNKYFIFFVLTFYFLWSIKEILFSLYINPTNNKNLITSLSALFKILIWVMPVFLYVRFLLNAKFITYLKLNNNILRGIKWGFGLSILIGIRFVIETYDIRSQSFNFSLDINTCINVIILAGFLEEILFRGFILTELQKKFIFWKANVITAILFLIVHYPTWILNGTFESLWLHLYILLLGLLFGYIYKETQSLWSVIIIHSLHNFFTSIS